MKRIYKKYLYVFILICPILLTLITASLSSLIRNEGSQRITLSAENIDISSNTSPQADGSYIEGSDIKFSVTDDSYSKVKIEIKGDGRIWRYDLENGGKWTTKWDTEEPKKGDDPVKPATYTLKLVIDGETVESNPASIIISSEESGISLPVLIVIIIAIIGGVSASAFVVIRKKRRGKAEDLEFDKVDGTTKKKKKGKVYTGASAIGKSSGELAKEKMKGKETPVKSKPEKKPKKEPKAKKTQMMPGSGEFRFETKASSSAVMMKELEKKMDLGQKLDFLTSKVHSVLQNVDFYKVILLQQDQEELGCPTCDRKMLGYWAMCPYCAIKEYDSELSLKQSVIAISDDVKFCPKCKRLIQPSWIECPFCYASTK